MKSGPFFEPGLGSLLHVICSSSRINSFKHTNKKTNKQVSTVRKQVSWDDFGNNLFEIISMNPIPTGGMVTTSEGGGAIF
jgi:hypothetical protein